MPLNPVHTYSIDSLQPALQPEWARTEALKPAANLVNVPKGAVFEEVATTQNNIWSIAGTPSGTWTLTFRGFTTAALSATITGAALLTALNLLPSINGGISAQSGGAIGSAAVLLTFGNAPFTSSPVELPTASQAMTITQNQVGSLIGTVQPSPASASLARFLSKYQFSTDGAGNVTFASAAIGEEFGQLRSIAPFFYQGYFKIEDLPLAAITGITGGYLNAAKSTELGKVIHGTVASGVGLLQMP